MATFYQKIFQMQKMKIPWMIPYSSLFICMYNCVNKPTFFLNTEANYIPPSKNIDINAKVSNCIKINATAPTTPTKIAWKIFGVTINNMYMLFDGTGNSFRLQKNWTQMFISVGLLLANANELFRQFFCSFFLRSVRKCCYAFA